MAIQYFSFGGGPVKTTWNEVRTTMLAQHDIARIVVVNRDEAQIYLKEDSYEKYADKLNTGFGAPSKFGPHFIFTIGTVETFENNLNEAQENFAEDQKVTPEYNNVTNYFGEIISWILPFLIIIAIWWWIFRRMSKGAGGAGGAGNIFNVGKSQAKVFDKDSRVSTTFKDVAGLAEAKQEVEEVVSFFEKPCQIHQIGR